MKKVYMKPVLQVVKLQHQHIICTSPFGANNVSNSESISWKEGGFADNEVDY